MGSDACHCLFFKEFLAFELHADLGQVDAEELDLRGANRLDEIPQVAFGDGNRCENLVRRVAVVMATFVNEEEHRGRGQGWLLVPGAILARYSGAHMR